jgi:hypothetical protein
MFKEILIAIFMGIARRQAVDSFLNRWMLQPAQPLCGSPGSAGVSPQFLYFRDFNVVHQRA